MKFKQILSLVVASVITVSALTACGNSAENNSTSPSKSQAIQDGSTSESENASSATSEATEDAEEGIVFPLEETVKFTGFAAMNGEVALSDTLTWKTMLEMGNIEVDLTNVLNTDVDEKRNLLLSSGQYPDFFIKANIDANKYGPEGILIPLEDLIREYAPNLTALLDERDGWKALKASDGHIYGLPEIDLQGFKNHVLWINQVWLDNLGLKEPTNFEELYEVLKAFKEQDANGNGDPNDEIPFSDHADSNVFKWFQYNDYVVDQSNFVGYNNGELVYMGTSDSMKELLQFLAKLYDEGIMHKDSFTWAAESWKATAQTTDTFGSFFNNASFSIVGTEADEDYTIVSPFHAAPRGAFSASPKAFAITDKCENPEILIAWIDYLYSEEGGKLAWMGIEGETYEYYEDGTWGWILGNGYGDDVTTIRSTATMQGARVHPSVQPEEWSNMSPEIDPEESYYNAQRAEKVFPYVELIPTLALTEEESEIVSTVKTDVDAYIKEYAAKVIIGELSLEDSWEEYLATLKTMNVDKLIACYQAAYERATAE